MSQAIQLKSSQFNHQTGIPQELTCKGSNVSPELDWINFPANTQSFAITCIDYDAPSGKFIHWIIFNIPSHIDHLDKGFKRDGSYPQGLNSFRKIGYDGPCPPPGKPHRYVFTLYALDNMLNLSSGVKLEDFEKAIQPHILSKSELIGLFGT